MKLSHVFHIMIWGAYEIKIARNNNVRNIFNTKYNQITVYTYQYIIPPWEHMTTIVYVQARIDDMGVKRQWPHGPV